MMTKVLPGPRKRKKPWESRTSPVSSRKCFIATCSVCGEETRLYVNGLPICAYCDKVVIGQAGRAIAGVSEALTLARQEYRDALRKAYFRLEAASSAYAKALREYRAFKRE
jgi:hypothetical protein